MNSNGKKDKDQECSINKMKKCCVINCRRKITAGTGVNIGEKVYCTMCGTLILKDILGLG